LGKIYDALEKFKSESNPAPLGGVRGIVSEKTGSEKCGNFQIHGEQLPPVNTLDRNVVAYNDPLSYAAEQFKILRTRLLFPLEGAPPRTIMVTSALQNEGKSFTAANLAVSIALGINDHVLLMDCDMRRPTQHRLFGFGVGDGLSDYLGGRRKLEDILLKTSVEKLTLLPGGRTPHNPSELLSSSRMSELLMEVKERYHDRYIIVDSPPPHLTAEATALAGQMDGILLVMRYFKTPRIQVEKLVEKIGKNKILGILLNQFDQPLMKYRGYTHYSTAGAVQ